MLGACFYCWDLPATGRQALVPFSVLLAFWICCCLSLWLFSELLAAFPFCFGCFLGSGPSGLCPWLVFVDLGSLRRLAATARTYYGTVLVQCFLCLFCDCVFALLECAQCLLCTRVQCPVCEQCDASILYVCAQRGSYFSLFFCVICAAQSCGCSSAPRCFLGAASAVGMLLVHLGACGFAGLCAFAPSFCLCTSL